MDTKCGIALTRPQTTQLSEIEGMLNSMRSFEIDRANYVACPITGGPLYVEMVSSNLNGISNSVFEALIERNVALANDFCSQVRHRTRRVCINPAVLKRKHWSQDDYRYFWSRVIELFAESVYLSRGWELSSGCLLECLLAVRLNLPLFNHELMKLDHVDAIELALSGIDTLQSLGKNSSFLKALAEQFQE
jgi:hypothetical protein